MIKTNLIIVTIFFTLSVYPEVSIERLSKSEWLLSGSSCTELKNEEKGIVEWSKKVQAKNTFNKNKCNCDSFGKCEIDISDILPDFSKKWDGIKSKLYAGNCWNTALVQSGLLPYMRLTTPSEVQYFLNSSLCIEKKVSEGINPGDFIVYREKPNVFNSSDGKAFSELHMSVAISKNFVFQKPAAGAGQPIEITNIKYPMSLITHDKCAHLYGGLESNAKLNELCNRWYQVFSCDYKNKKTVLKQEAIDKIEEELSYWVDYDVSKAKSFNFLKHERALQNIIKAIEGNSEPLSERFTSIRAKSSLEYIDAIKFNYQNTKTIKENEGSLKNIDDWFKDRSQMTYDWYYKTQIPEIDALYELKNFIINYGRIPLELSLNAIERDLFNKLMGLGLFDKIKHSPEDRYSFFLNPKMPN